MDDVLDLEADHGEGRAPILYYTILYYTMLCCTILYYAILYYAITCCTMLCYAILYYTVVRAEGALGTKGARVERRDC